MTVDGFLSFLDEIDLFQKTYDQRVSHIFTHLCRPIQQEVAGLLLLHKGQRFKEMRDIHKANPKDIYQVAQYLFAPLDLTDFNKSLQESCKDYRVFMRQENFSKTRLDLYYLKGKFKYRATIIIKWEIYPAHVETTSSICK